MPLFTLRWALLSRRPGNSMKPSRKHRKSPNWIPALAGQTYYNLGAMLGNGGKTKESVEFFKKAIEVDPKNADAYYQLGLSYFASADTIPAAIPVLQKYLDLQPNGTNAEAAKQLIATAKASAPSGGKKD